MANFLISVRNIEEKKNGTEFGDEPGEASFLVVPDNATDFSPADMAKDEKAWLTKLLAGKTLTDILIYVHGFNMKREITLERHKILKKNLSDRGWKGELITFAWPSKKHTLLYWEDRFDALDTAYQLVSRCIKLLNNQVANGCDIKVHILAHSTGALIVRESFKIAQSALLEKEAVWTTGQIIFVAGDVSSESMEGSPSEALYRHCGRLTNYFSHHDSALAVSSAKRLGFANRVGRVGLPYGSPEKAVDVNCSDHYKKNAGDLKKAVVHAELSHSWYFWSDTFLQDLIITLNGELDRNVIPTREEDDRGEFWLKD